MSTATNPLVIEHALAVAFGNAHPFFWPSIPPRPARWWQRGLRRTERKINQVFHELGYNPLNQPMRDRYWREVRKGQSIHEDAGGYGLRQWLGALNLPTEQVVTYADFIQGVTKARPRTDTATSTGEG